jgi:hypothetical protein
MLIGIGNSDEESEATDPAVNSLKCWQEDNLLFN